jgi:hypothetical protein
MIKQIERTAEGQRCEFCQRVHPALPKVLREE